ncbi:SCP2 sterol-binding domain-containing protein [Brevibacillus daliensis]|uniref:SCP2 sterol-binding domain-containing protein n=1 Tax=Brevibacillus daliensis TaxID=2892995 RepID=UPI001E349536|nr:SCP2 sterol-binding domain-containing protein [Brevibacillus daliensis]
MVKQALEQLVAKINGNPEVIKGWDVIYQFDISGENGGTFQARFQDEKAEIVEGTPFEPQCTLQLSDQNFIKLINNQLNPTTAFMTGKLKVKGDVSLALKLKGLFKK